MSSTVIFVGLPENSKSSIIKAPLVAESRSLDAFMVCVDLDKPTTNTGGSAEYIVNEGVPNAPKSCIAEIFNADTVDGTPIKNGASRPRAVRDTPTRPRDTHSRLFGQVHNSGVAPMVTDTIRSHIQFGDNQMNGHSPSQSPNKLSNGSASSTPSRALYSPPKRNPVTGDGVIVPPPRRRHPAACLREGNPITGDGYKSMNGMINTVTSISGNSNMILHNRVPPGGHSSGLW